MCLDKNFDEKKTEKILKKLPEEITVYKVIQKNKSEKCYTGLFHVKFEYKEGENRAEISNFTPIDSGFYTFKTKIGAWIYNFGSSIKASIIKCKLYKKDIRAIGKQGGFLTFVSSKLTVPKYKD